MQEQGEKNRILCNRACCMLRKKGGNKGRSDWLADAMRMLKLFFFFLVLVQYSEVEKQAKDANVNLSFRPSSNLATVKLRTL